MFNEIALLIGLTLLPFLELRASIPYGLLNTSLHWSVVFFICVLTNALLGPFIFLLLDKGVHLLFHFKSLERLYHRHVEKTQKKIHPYVEKYGELGLALFIGIPLPGSGSYSGALGAYILGLDFRKFFIANLIGVLIAGIAVTAIVLTGTGVSSLFIKAI